MTFMRTFPKKGGRIIGERCIRDPNNGGGVWEKEKYSHNYKVIIYIEFR